MDMQTLQAEFDRKAEISVFGTDLLNYGRDFLTLLDRIDSTSSTATQDHVFCSDRTLFSLLKASNEQTFQSVIFNFGKFDSRNRSVPVSILVELWNRIHEAENIDTFIVRIYDQKNSNQHSEALRRILEALKSKRIDLFLEVYTNLQQTVDVLTATLPGSKYRKVEFIARDRRVFGAPNLRGDGFFVALGKLPLEELTVLDRCDNLAWENIPEDFFRFWFTYPNRKNLRIDVTLDGGLPTTADVTKFAFPPATESVLVDLRSSHDGSTIRMRENIQGSNVRNLLWNIVSESGILPNYDVVSEIYAMIA